MAPYVVALFLVQAPSGPDVSSWQFRVLMGLGEPPDASAVGQWQWQWQQRWHHINRL